MLGVAFGERSALLAEVASSDGGPRLVRGGEFAYPEGLRLDDAEALGKALRGFLRSNHFSCRTAVLGLPAKWVLSKRKDVPAADPSLVTETLRLQAEGEFPTELKDLTFDYAGEPSASESRSVLLVAAQKRYIDQATGVASEAGLRAVAVAPYGAAVGAAINPGAKDAAAVIMGPGGAEFVARQHGQPRVMRYLGSPASPAPVLGGELRRAAAGMPVNGTTPGILLWNDSGVDASILQKLGDVVGAPLRQGALSEMGVSAAPEAGDGRAYAAAVALALGGLGAVPAPIDLLHPKLAPPKPPGIDRRVLIGSLAGAAVLLAIGWAGYDVYRQQADLSKAKAELVANAPRVKVVKAQVDRISFARGWHGEKPRYLACLRDLTNIIPEDGSMFLIRFNLQEQTDQTPQTKEQQNMKGVMAGRTANDQKARWFYDKLVGNSRFTNLKLGFDPPEQGRAGNEASFTITFEYVPEK